MRRWGKGKGSLSKEQIACLDKHAHQAYWTYWPRVIYDFPELNKLLEEEEEDKNED